MRLNILPAYFNFKISQNSWNNIQWTEICTALRCFFQSENWKSTVVYIPLKYIIHTQN